MTGRPRAAAARLCFWSGAPRVLRVGGSCVCVPGCVLACRSQLPAGQLQAGALCARGVLLVLLAAAQMPALNDLDSLLGLQARFSVILHRVMSLKVG